MIPTSNAPETMADHAPESNTGSTHAAEAVAETAPVTEMEATVESVTEEKAQVEPVAEIATEAEPKAESKEAIAEGTSAPESKVESIQTAVTSDAEEPEEKAVEEVVAKSTPKPIAVAKHMGEEPIASDTPKETGVAHESNNMIPEVLAKIAARIDALELQPLETPDNFKAFWSQVKVTNENFKHYSKLIPKETHEELWKRFDQLCERAKQTQEKIKSSFENVSRTKRQAIENAVNEASELIATDLVKADGLLRKALKYLKDDWADLKNTISLTEEEWKVRMGREDQDAAWQLWKSTNEHYMTQQQQLRQNNFIAINKEVMEMKAPVETGDPFEALNLIKNMQAKLRGMHLPKGDWEEIQNVLREYWDLVDKRVKHEKQNRTTDRRNKDSIFVIKHQQWITRQEANAQRFKDLIRKNEEVLKNLEEHTEKLKNDLTTAMSDKFKDKIEEWIKEKENKIADIIRTNADLEKRIVDIKKKLAEGDTSEDKPSADTHKPSVIAEEEVTNPAIETEAEVTTEVPTDIPS